MRPPEAEQLSVSSLSWMQRIGFGLLFVLALSLNACSRSRWNESSRGSADLAPLPDKYSDAVVMAFRARVWGVRGWFADHSWLATKDQNEDSYTVYEVIGWRKFRNQSVVRIAPDIPDRFWFGARPRTMIDIRGETARDLISKIDVAARSYPYPDEYRAFPGPNSNTFIAWISRQVPEMNLHMPIRAVGRGYK